MNFFRAEQARIVRLRVERVDVAPDGIRVRLRAEGLHTLVEQSPLPARRGRHDDTAPSSQLPTGGSCRWQFEGKTITVHIPMTLAQRGGRKVILAPGGGNAWRPARPSPDEALIRALVRAHRWKRLLEADRDRLAGDLAEAEASCAASSAACSA